MGFFRGFFRFFYAQANSMVFVTRRLLAFVFTSMLLTLFGCVNAEVLLLSQVDDASLLGVEWIGSATVDSCGGNTGQCPFSLIDAPLRAGRRANPSQDPDIILNIMENRRANLTLNLSYPGIPPLSPLFKTYVYEFGAYSREIIENEAYPSIPIQILDFIVTIKAKSEGIELPPTDDPTNDNSPYEIVIREFRLEQRYEHLEGGINISLTRLNDQSAVRYSVHMERR